MHNYYNQIKQIFTICFTQTKPLTFQPKANTHVILYVCCQNEHSKEQHRTQGMLSTADILLKMRVEVQ